MYKQGRHLHRVGLLPAFPYFSSHLNITYSFCLLFQRFDLISLVDTADQSPLFYFKYVTGWSKRGEEFFDGIPQNIGPIEEIEMTTIRIH